ncbi:MAG TPA: ADP-ribosylglycohydrolase family protein [Chitinophagaceae bacterium]|nr:ADP-ribosylglycohydrolase family protein [Chitinophagaceae bacterium]
MIKAAIIGLAVGDALGVPVEFRDRSLLKEDPVTGMREFGTHGQPLGTWSDDSAMVFCTMESLLDGYDPVRMAGKFVDWLYKNHWTPHGKVFDAGGATRNAIAKIASNVNPLEAGGKGEDSNGNGSLMRILPLLWHVRELPESDRFKAISQVSSLTHAHIRSVLACYYYLEFARGILEGRDKFKVYADLQSSLPVYLGLLQVPDPELNLFSRLFEEKIWQLDEDDIRSSGYVIHTLEASIWSVLTTDNYSDAVLRAVNLGDDTDTTGAVAGGLAGMIYGYESIPTDWVNALVRKEDIFELVDKFCGVYG